MQIKISNFIPYIVNFLDANTKLSLFFAIKM